MAAVTSSAVVSSSLPAATIPSSSLLMSACTGKPRLEVTPNPSSASAWRAVAPSNVVGSISGNSTRSKPARRVFLTESMIPCWSKTPVHTKA